MRIMESEPLSKYEPEIKRLGIQTCFIEKTKYECISDYVNFKGYLNNLFYTIIIYFRGGFFMVELFYVFSSKCV